MIDAKRRKCVESDEAPTTTTKENTKFGERFDVLFQCKSDEEFISVCCL
jgi:hypothetical protein